MNKVLVTGSKGFLGTRLVEAYNPRYEVIGVSHEDIDITNREEVLALIQREQPDYVIHCAAISDTAYVQEHKREGFRVNVLGTDYVAYACKEVGAKLIYMSSDQIYNGSREAKPLGEEEKVMPISEYGMQKLESERRVKMILPEAVGLRLTWMYDLPRYHKKINSNFLWNMIRASIKGEQIEFSEQEYRGITYIREVVDNIEKAMQLPGGIYNFGSENNKNSLELAKETEKLLQCVPTVVVKRKTTSAQFRNLSMNTEKAKKQDILFLDSLEGIRKCLEDYGYLQENK